MTRLYETIRNLLITTLATSALGVAQAQPPVVHPPQPPRRVAVESDQPADPGRALPTSFRIPEGTPISVRPIRTLSSDYNVSGDIFEAILDQDIHAGDRLVLAQGSRVFGEVQEAMQGGRVQGRAQLTITLREVEIEGNRYPIETSPITVVAAGSKTSDAKKVGIAAGIGAVIGAIAGGKKGAAIGATIGGGAQTARVLTSRGKAAEIEQERLLSFRLEKEFEYLGS